MMAQYLQGKVVYVIGPGGDGHRGIAVALAEAGADIAIGGRGGMPEEVPLHSIANEIWALGRRSAVVPLDDTDPVSFANALSRVAEELGHATIVLRCEDVISA
jgi:NAD(P)-dependent dehydrogenase (short-subunit alcohol dehydrogenase family)